MPVVAITGGVGSGKSTAAEFFRELGAVVLSADQAARQIMLPGAETFREVIQAFGEEYLLPDGSLDRKRLGELIFSDPSARKRLEEITHPAIHALLRAEVQMTLQRDPGALVVVEIPLLYETGGESEYDAVITVSSS